MENQQGTEAELAYLAGIIDGEGSIYVAVHKDRRKTYLVMEVKIPNTHFGLIEYLSSILKEFDIAHYVSIRNGKIHHKTAKVINITGLKRINKLLPKIIPYLVAKKEQAELAMLFIESRLSNTSRKAPYLEKEIDWMERIKKLNRKGNGHLNDYTSPFTNINVKKI